MKTLLLIDGSSYLYRAFHAIQNLKNSAGEPTNALYGVINMLRKLQKEVQADYSACVFDAKGKTFRDDWYPDYKANRPPMPDDLRSQIEPVHAAVRALGFPLLMVDGVEADDVIGTLAEQAWRNGIKTIVSTGDKDMAQLVNEHVTLVNTMTSETLDIDGVKGKFGVAPGQIVDYLTLIGDTVDNVPGVDKCGPKTAVKWLTEYGSLDNIVANADKIGGVVGQNLRNKLDWLPMGRKLVTIKCDVGDIPAPGELGWLPQDRDTLLALFTRYEFKTWLKELQAGAAPQAAPVAAPSPAASPAQSGAQAGFDFAAQAARHYECITTEAQLDAWLRKIDAAALTCVDTETTSLDPMLARIVGISLAVTPHEAAYIPLAHRYAGVPDQLDLDATLAALKPWFENPAKPKLGQNLKYDQHVLANHGIHLAGVAHDTLLQSYVLESHKTHNMDDLALRHLGATTISYEDVCGKGAKQIGFDAVDVQRATDYSAEDADITLQLHQALYPQLDDKIRHIYEAIEMPVREVLFKIERNGVLIDPHRLNQQSHELGQRMLEIEQRTYDAAGQPFNLGSPKQIGEILFERLQLPVIKKTPKGAPSTDEDVLEKLAHDYPLPKLILEYRGMAKLKSTYTDKLPLMINPATGRVHTNYAQAVAITGRLASNDPNLQNIPVRTGEGRRIREAFVAAPGHKLISADYSQIELRIMAHLSGDENLLAAFARGEDIHRATAAEVFGLEPAAVTSEQRRYAKAINFGLIYGMSAFGLAAQLEIERSAAQMYIDRYFARYPGVKAYMDRTREMAKQHGYVETVFGRRLWLPEINAAQPMRRQGAERAAINAPMQGTAADLIKLAMIAVQGWLETDRLATRIIMQVHDELVLEVPDAEMDRVKTRLPELMAGVAELKVPLVAEAGVGGNWEEAH
ncbi:DNA polymerase I [Chitinivorax sp. PXF-14]|uniref:DNA polymerase I n=1 Tax=Chitinivorax sp. PXF-14 TaxID=3230488 RepID=UPI003466841A